MPSGSRSSFPCRVEVPGLLDPLEGVLTSIVEDEAGSRDEILHSARDQHLPGTGEGGDPRPDVDGDAPDAVVDEFHFTRMHTRADLETEIVHRVADPVSTSDRSRRAFEHREESVAGGIDLGASVLGELRSDPLMV